MKLFTLVLLGSNAQQLKPTKVKPPVGCDPAWLGEYKITTDCKRKKGFNTVRDENGVLLEKKSNFCRRQCKYGSLPETTYTMCKCKADRSNGVRVFNCWYQIKLARTIKGWVPFNHTIDGNYPLDKWGYGGKQASCVLPSEKGTWGEWSEFGPCDGTCGLGERKRTRQCSSEYCGDEPSMETMKCLAYSDYSLSSSHSCGNAKQWWQPHSMGDDFTWLNEGNHCLFPSFGRGWATETIDGEVVEMGVECESGWNYDTHSIAPLNGKCKLVCRGSKGGQYMPKTSHWSNLQCLSPITVQYLDPSKPHGINDWMSQGLDMGPDEPWYFNRQNWPRFMCWPGCGTHKTLTETRDIIDKCYKVGSEPKCSATPPLTDFETKHGTSANAINWDCTNGNQPGSTCTKTCGNHHVEHIGNPNQICECEGDDCEWKRTDQHFVYVVYKERPMSCIKGCDAQPDTMWEDKHYKVSCDQDDLTTWSDSIATNAVVYQWNWPTPVKVNNKCTIKCDDHNPINGYPREWQMAGWAETGIDSFDIQCKKTDNGMEWVGDFKECIQVCYAITGEGWSCSDDFFIGSTCTKTCPPGYKFDKNQPSWYKTSTRCRKKSYGSAWSNTHFKDCVPE